MRAKNGLNTKSIADVKPELVAEWHYDKNYPHTPHNVSYGSKEKYWWICSVDKSHIYDAVVHNRTSKNARGCPFCSGKRPHPTNCLATHFPEIAAEWDYVKNDPKTPFDFTKNSNKFAWWLCSNGHSYRAVINNRTSTKTGCPYCNNQKASKENCLETNNPNLAKEWHPTLNKLSPREVLPFSNKKYWWICEHGHEFKSSLCGRNNGGSGCPYCFASNGEIKLLEIVKNQFFEYKVDFRYKHPDLRFSESNRLMEFDVFVHKINLAFEFQGEQHYRPTWGEESFLKLKIRDQEKREAAKANGIYLIEIDHTWDLSEELVLNEIEKFFLNPEW